MKNWTLVLALCLVTISFAAPLFATDLSVDEVEVQGRTVSFVLSWKNAWRKARNHDAAWITLRPRGNPAQGILQLAAEGHSAESSDLPVELQVSPDRLGVFVFAGDEYRGDVRWILSLRLSENAPEDVDIWALEMVYIPGGSYALGDSHPDLLADSSFYRVGDDGTPAGPFQVESEAAVEVADRAGALYYQVRDVPQYRGDQQGSIPASFPKGTRPFYIMKYELTQGQYARFLNALPDSWLEARANHQVEGEEAETCTIQLEQETFSAGAPNRPCNFISWADSAAFADWMALRPMTEFEYEKAARGPRQPIPRDYPWGIATRGNLRRTVTPERDLRASAPEDERSLEDATREIHGASFYWVMDLSGSLWERVVSAGHPAGRSFLGSHGDGALDPVTGRATNPDWPHMSPDGRAADGIGYRGGAAYFGNEGLTNPYSPVASRTFAAWNGAYRYKTYSARAVRTAP